MGAVIIVWAVSNHHGGLSGKATVIAATAVGERENCGARGFPSTSPGAMHQSLHGDVGPGWAGLQPGEPWATAHLLHAASGHRGQGVGHQAGAQAPEQPYLSIHLDNVLGCKKAKGAASRPAQDTHC